MRSTAFTRVIVQCRGPNAVQTTLCQKWREKASRGSAWQPLTAQRFAKSLTDGALLDSSSPFLSCSYLLVSGSPLPGWATIGGRAGVDLRDQVYTPHTTTSTSCKSGQKCAAVKQAVQKASERLASFDGAGPQKLQNLVHLEAHACGTLLFASGALRRVSSLKLGDSSSPDGGGGGRRDRGTVECCTGLPRELPNQAEDARVERAKQWPGRSTDHTRQHRAERQMCIREAVYHAREAVVQGDTPTSRRQPVAPAGPTTFTIWTPGCHGLMAIWGGGQDLIKASPAKVQVEPLVD